MEHLINFFPITNQDKLRIPYRLFEVSEVPDNVERFKNFQVIKSYVAREFGTPTAWVIREGKRYLAVAPQPKKVSYPLSLPVTILQGLIAQLRLVSGVHTIEAAKPKEDEQGVVISFIDYALRSRLRDVDGSPGRKQNFTTKREIGAECFSTIPTATYGSIFNLTAIFANINSPENLPCRVRHSTPARNLFMSVAGKCRTTVAFYSVFQS